MDPYAPHPLVVAVASGVLDGGKYRGNAELYTAAWRVSEAKRAAVNTWVAELVGQLVEGDNLKTVVGELSTARSDAQAATAARNAMARLRAKASAAISDGAGRAIPDDQVDEFEKKLMEIGKNTRGKRKVAKELWKTVGNVGAPWRTASDSAADLDQELEMQARTIANSFVTHADAPDVLAASGYLGGITPADGGDPWQFVYLEETLQLWLLIKPGDIVWMVRVPDAKQPFGCKPDTIWVKGYTPVITGDARLTAQAITERIANKNFTTAADAINALTRGTTGASARTFGDEILTQGFTSSWWCDK